MTARVRVGTRRSPLARVQTESVVRRLAKAHPRLRLETVPIETSGDRRAAGPAATDFTDAIDDALRRGAIDLGVHSAKDLPAVLPGEFALAAVPRRADPRDALVVASWIVGTRLPRGARVGSSSPRRRAQLLRWRSDLRVVELRGNVGTRLARLEDGSLDAAVLAVAGLVRLRRRRAIATPLSPQRFLPAPGQGALAVVSRAGERALLRTLGAIDHAPSRAEVAAERAMAASLGGSCRVPLGALASARGPRLTLVGEVLTPDGRGALRVRLAGPRAEAEALGRRAAARLRQLGAGELLSTVGP